MLAAGNTAFMYGVRHVDYANAIAILYIYPFIMIALSALVLGERVSGFGLDRRGGWFFRRPAGCAAGHVGA